MQFVVATFRSLGTCEEDPNKYQISIEFVTTAGFIDVSRERNCVTVDRADGGQLFRLFCELSKCLIA